MSILDQLYTKLPIAGRQLAVGLAGARNKSIRRGRFFDEQRKLLDQSQYWSNEQMLKHQAHQLHLLVNEAKSFTTAYASLPSLSINEAHRMVQAHDFSSFPILEKSTLKSSIDSFRNSSRRPDSVSRTSGTTGSPMQNERDSESSQRTNAFLAQQLDWAGTSQSSRSVRLSGRQLVPTTRQRPPFWMTNWVSNQLLLSTYHLSGKNIGPIADKLNSFRPEFIDGYPSATAELGKLLGSQARLSSLKAVISTAETLSDELRQSIEESFGVPVFDYYAASEGVPLIQQCIRGSYHIRGESGIFEVLDDAGREVSAGETGELVVTSFCNFRTPLIRYRTGDLATRATSESSCGCGRSLPLMGRILGRSEDNVVTRDGRNISFFAHRVVTPLSGIVAAQFIQTSIDQFTVRIVPENGVSVDDLVPLIEESIRKTLGYSPGISVEPADEIPKGPNGKVRAVVRMFAS